MRPRLLDLFCGEGGASAGYEWAGFEVVGVDLQPQPRYPYPFLQMDALLLDARFLTAFDLVHASPPCQRFTALRFAKGAKGDAHPNLIAPTRAMLQKAGVPYVIENVEAARAELIDPVLLCGAVFGLGAEVGGRWFQLRRHRLFETSWGLGALCDCDHQDDHPVIGIYGGHVRNRGASHGGRGTVDFVGEDRPRLAREAMGMPWATMKGMSEAIPPIYSRYIGGKFLQARRQQEAA